uniref:ATP synthase F0 subunit 8 n=1 Tax=Carpoglyphus lactis TaxID=223459 RepID=A0A7D4W8K0_CARLC|nr:ATP synthase F0 subunit 8 [Carpoglyphus lactis]QKV10185.1 ATP synthase F0 subunit 8 [Carpoglyphus lactis]
MLPQMMPFPWVIFFLFSFIFFFSMSLYLKNLTFKHFTFSKPLKLNSSNLPW